MSARKIDERYATKAKYYCDYCHTFVQSSSTAKNAHENSYRHKENVRKFLMEAGKRSKMDSMAERALSKELKALEKIADKQAKADASGRKTSDSGYAMPPPSKRRAGPGGIAIPQISPMVLKQMAGVDPADRDDMQFPGVQLEDKSTWKQTESVWRQYNTFQQWQIQQQQQAYYMNIAKQQLESLNKPGAPSTTDTPPSDATSTLPPGTTVETNAIPPPPGVTSEQALPPPPGVTSAPSPSKEPEAAAEQRTTQPKSESADKLANFSLRLANPEAAAMPGTWERVDPADSFFSRAAATEEDEDEYTSSKTQRREGTVEYHSDSEEEEDDDDDDEEEEEIEAYADDAEDEFSVPKLDFSAVAAPRRTSSSIEPVQFPLRIIKTEHVKKEQLETKTEPNAPTATPTQSEHVVSLFPKSRGKERQFRRKAPSSP